MAEFGLQWPIRGSDKRKSKVKGKPCHRRGPRPAKGIRNHNPLNIEAGCDWLGATGCDGRFVIFTSPWHGIRAGARVLRTYQRVHGIYTIDAIVSRWAPIHDNNPTHAYIDFVASSAGVAATSALTPEDYPRVLAAMIQFENGTCPYEMELINNAVAAGWAD
ncbi:virion protein [Shewanella sp. NIFS-20-20]|uniref:virion protein n=1 Tax=Shewanella sp. NIFS-20-20 TaxID=2853806 RepID=UPI001C45B62E|nr:virion protein [Shewanella sp. NIFS-20-20]MBV7314628.1 virion protein [Shewanella sp. NIFS-20-20]